MKVAETKRREATERENYLQSQVKVARSKLDGSTPDTNIAAQHLVIGARDQQHSKARDATVKAEAAFLGATKDCNVTAQLSAVGFSSRGSV